jgi:hypothetical protein
LIVERGRSLRERRASTFFPRAATAIETIRAVSFIVN